MWLTYLTFQGVCSLVFLPLQHWSNHLTVARTDRLVVAGTGMVQTGSGVMLDVKSQVWKDEKGYADQKQQFVGISDKYC